MMSGLAERRYPPMNRRYAGLSLLELNVAIVVAALIMFAVFQLIASGMRLQSANVVNGRLAALAQKAIELKRLEVFEKGSANQPLPSSPSGRQAFTAPDDEYGYDVTYYTYEKPFAFPPDVKLVIIPISWPDPNKAMYMIAMKVVVDGPLASGGAKRAFYRSVQVVTLMQYPVYRSATPPSSNVMYPLPAPTPLIPIGMP